MARPRPELINTTHERLEKQANKILHLKRSDNMLPVLDMEKSDAYQHLYRERFLEDFKKSHNDHDNLDEEEHHKIKMVPLYDQEDQQFLELNDRVVETFWNIMEPMMTDIQKQTVQMILEGKTQWEMAQIRGTNQSTIHKTICGNFIQDKEGYHPDKKHGGLRGKIKLLMGKEAFRKSVLKLYLHVHPDEHAIFDTDLV